MQGFDVTKIKIEVPSKELCEEHYVEHKEKPFFNELVNFLSSGPLCASCIKGWKCCIQG
jgi:nucleoside-diphosphate kinase